MIKLLLTGGSGQLGRCLLDRLPAQWLVLAPDHNELDITNAQSVDAYVKDQKPNIIINAAAFNAVDLAERHPVQAHEVNALGPANLAAAATQAKCGLVHISSDYVFDGKETVPYTEVSSPLPISQYGLSKLMGEQNVLSTLSDAIVIRTSWLYSEYGTNFVHRILDLALDRMAPQFVPGLQDERGDRTAKGARQLSVVDDQIGCPTYAGDLAHAIIELASRHYLGRPSDPATAADSEISDGNAPDTNRIFHYCGAQAMTWFEFARQILACARAAYPELDWPEPRAIKTSEYPAAAARPAMSALSCEKVQAMGISCHPLAQNLDYVIKRFLGLRIGAMGADS